MTSAWLRSTSCVAVISVAVRPLTISRSIVLRPFIRPLGKLGLITAAKFRKTRRIVPLARFDSVEGASSRPGIEIELVFWIRRAATDDR